MADEVERIDANDVLDVGAELVRYAALVVSLTVAGTRLNWLAGQVRSAYAYVEGCADATDRRAEEMAGLNVDEMTVGEHHDAAAAMRAALAEADRMAEAVEELAGLFVEASEAHQAEYGGVAEAANSMSVPMAQAGFYANR